MKSQLAQRGKECQGGFLQVERDGLRRKLLTGGVGGLRSNMRSNGAEDNKPERKPGLVVVFPNMIPGCPEYSQWSNVSGCGKDNHFFVIKEITNYRHNRMFFNVFLCQKLTGFL